MTISEFANEIKELSRDDANHRIFEVSGIVEFFDESLSNLSDSHIGRCEDEKGEFGDWQTNIELALSVCRLLKSKGISPSVVIEPTCGQGNFIIAALTIFGDSIRYLYGIEIYKPYVNRLKLRLLEYGLKNPNLRKPEIKIYHSNIFDFPLNKLKGHCNASILVLGNPPWVTNSKLGEIKSENLPKKTNFKNIKGLAAITGKGNFDIAEYITYQIFDHFGDIDTTLAFLVKTSVAKNIIFEQKQCKNRLSDCHQYNIDAKREFNVSVSACLFTSKLNSSNPSRQCEISDFYTQDAQTTFGWVDDKFVSNIDDYNEFKQIDGHSQLTWWSGMKHDCSKIMELSYRDGIYYNGLNEEVKIEPDLIYPLLKSSDVKDGKEITNRKFVIVTQRNTSENTRLIANNQPKTYSYLESHADFLDNRGSSIYRNRPRFCIFGIGKYSFAPYKIAIAGLYKSTRFSLVKPIDAKPVIFDDTCYLIAFDNLDFANQTLKILNSDPVQKFLQSTVFFDAKRSINKDLLMRIDLMAAAKINYEHGKMTETELTSYCRFLAPHNKISLQPTLFD
jgi:hypothetical protein